MKYAYIQLNLPPETRQNCYFNIIGTRLPVPTNSIRFLWVNGYASKVSNGLRYYLIEFTEYIYFLDDIILISTDGYKDQFEKVKRCVKRLDDQKSLENSTNGKLE